MNFTENEFRDYLFENYRNSISDLIIGRRDPVSWTGDDFPPLSFLLQQISEQKINKIIDGLASLTIAAKELRLERGSDTTTRIDLFGDSEANGLTIIELKKSKQTERQAYTELLAYANHFCCIFPGLSEVAINSILIAPMESRTVRDAFLQELLINNKSTAALIPKQENDIITLTVYYPKPSYYKWFENNLFDDNSLINTVIAFPLIDGWIDSDLKSDDTEIPSYSREALNTISSTISQRLESEGIHSIVYASQQWGEIAQHFPHPNRIFSIVINPFSSLRTKFVDGEAHGSSSLERLKEVQGIYNQLSEDQKEYWLDNLESSFHSLVVEIINDEFKKCFRQKDNLSIKSEISLPNWHFIKLDMLESVFTHNLDIFQSGLLRKVYMKYIDHMYNAKLDMFFYGEDLPRFSYDSLRNFLAVWEILQGLGLGDNQA
jgi:hypothetical protein